MMATAKYSKIIGVLGSLFVDSKMVYNTKELNMAKKVLVFVIAFGLSIGVADRPSFAETVAPEAEWDKTFGSEGDDRGYSVQQT